jgi:hypothetical protein
MINPQDFKHNHYVPEWYQRRFMLPSEERYWYLDLKPEQVVRNGHRYTAVTYYIGGRGNASPRTIFTRLGGALRKIGTSRSSSSGGSILKGNLRSRSIRISNLTYLGCTKAFSASSAI